MSYTTVINPCPTCGATPKSPNSDGGYPWYECEDGWIIECTNTDCKRRLCVSTKTRKTEEDGEEERIVERWNNPTEADWVSSDRKFKFWAEVAKILGDAWNMAKQSDNTKKR